MIATNRKWEMSSNLSARGRSGSNRKYAKILLVWVYYIDIETDKKKLFFLSGTRDTQKLIITRVNAAVVQNDNFQ